MGLHDGILSYILAQIDGLSLYSTADIGSLPAANGISVYLGPGGDDRTFFDKGSEGFSYITVNTKHTDQLTALQALDSIHEYLTKLTTYQNTDTYQITNIETNSAPSYIGEEEREGFLYGSILKITFFNKGVSS